MIAYSLLRLLEIGVPPEVAAETVGEIIENVIPTTVRIERDGDKVHFLYDEKPELVAMIETLKFKLPQRKRRRKQKPELPSAA